MLQLKRICHIHTFASAAVNVNVTVALFVYAAPLLMFIPHPFGAVLSKYIFALPDEFAARLFHALSVIAHELHTYIFHAHVFPLIVTHVVPLDAHAATVIVVLSVINSHGTALVHHPYLIVYVHAVNHAHPASDNVIVADLLFA